MILFQVVLNENDPPDSTYQSLDPATRNQAQFYSTLRHTHDLHHNLWTHTLICYCAPIFEFVELSCDLSALWVKEHVNRKPKKKQTFPSPPLCTGTCLTCYVGCCCSVPQVLKLNSYLWKFVPKLPHIIMVRQIKVNINK